MQDKIKLIDKICETHPSYGVDKGWSEYVGGMKDTGQWFFRKMLDVPQEELQEFLNGIIEKENKPKQQIKVSQIELWDKLYQKREYSIIFDPKITNK